MCSAYSRLSAMLTWSHSGLTHCVKAFPFHSDKAELSVCWGSSFKAQDYREMIHQCREWKKTPSPLPILSVWSAQAFVLVVLNGSCVCLRVHSWVLNIAGSSWNTAACCVMPWSLPADRNLNYRWMKRIKWWIVIIISAVYQKIWLKGRFISSLSLTSCKLWFTWQTKAAIDFILQQVGTRLCSCFIAVVVVLFFFGCCHGKSDDLNCNQPRMTPWCTLQVKV